MWERQFSGWRADWHSGAEQRERATAELFALVGRRVTATWVVWDPEDDTWFSDGPVVFVLDDGRQLELGWQKFDDLSVTWGTVDLATTPTWYERQVEWRRDALPPLRGVAGGTVTDLAWTEHTMVISRSRWWRRDGSTTWLVGGVWIGTDAGGVLVYDALDENGLADELPTPGPGHRVHPF
jgi:hypothetical protein